MQAWGVCLAMLLTACATRHTHDTDMQSRLHLPEPALPALVAQPTPPTPSLEDEYPLPSQLPAQAAIPSGQYAYPLINLEVHQAPVQEVLYSLARESGINMDVHPALQGRVSIHAVKQSLPEILARIAKQVDLHYEFHHGVWQVSPDNPIIRTYKLNYVNMTRDTSGFIGVATEINSTGRSNLSTGASNAGGMPSGGSATVMGNAGSSNSSRTAVASQSRYHLWESVLQNVQALLEETDKQAIVQRYGVETEAATPLQIDPSLEEGLPPDTTAGVIKPPSPPQKTDRDKQRAEYSKLIASRLIANPETGVLTVRATHRQQQLVKAYLQSVMQIAARQVLIEATIVEVELGKSFQMGIDWSRLANNAASRGWFFAQSMGNRAAQLNPQTGQLESNNSKDALGQNNGNVALVLQYLNPLSRLGNLSASITLLEQFGKTRVLSSPKLMVLNNQTAMLKVVDNLVYFTIQSQISQGASTIGGNLQAVTTIANTVPVGLVMAVTAQINGQQRVNLNVRPTVSRVLRYVEDPNPQLGIGNSRIVSSIPEIQVRELESVLNVNSGQVAVLGGLMQEEQRSLNDQIPGLANVPVLGQAFKGKNQASRKTELVVFLRPTVIAQADVETGELQAFKPLLPAPETNAEPLSQMQGGAP